jgi:hypothetical protein
MSHILPSLDQPIIRQKFKTGIYQLQDTEQNQKIPAKLNVYNVYNPGRNPKTKDGQEHLTHVQEWLFGSK